MASVMISSSAADEEVERLESMMRMTQGDTGGDPGMQQINDVLGKILDIQHPERMNERAKQLEKDRVTYSATPFDGKDVVNLIRNGGGIPFYDSADFTTIQLNGFYGIGNESSTTESDNAIAASVYSDQTLVNGSFVKLILQHDVKVKAH